MRKQFVCLCALVLTVGALCVPLPLYASEVVPLAGEASFVQTEITNETGTQQTTLQDDNTTSGLDLQEGSSLTLVPSEPAAALYIVWELYPAAGYTVQQNEVHLEQNSGFLQEYVPLVLQADVPVTIRFNSVCTPVEIRLLSEGTPPENVHAWQAPHERADILLLPTHADDEHLFMGGIMPTYLDRGNVSVQVAYMVNHSTEPYRQQELLDGLWEVGMRHYPVIPAFPDQYSDSLEHAKTIYSEQEIIDYVAGLFERFRPQVAVGHDLNGEYGHGAHMLYAECLLKATEQSAVPPQKVYLHLYGENEIVMNTNTPLESFGGRTAFEMAEAGFSHHRSQQSYFTVEAEGPYDLRKFGLANSQVGTDSDNDMMENIIPYAEQDRIAQELAEQEAAAAASAAAQQASALSAAQNAPVATASVPDLQEEQVQNTSLLLVLVALLTTLLVLGILFFAFRKSQKNSKGTRRGPPAHRK